MKFKSRTAATLSPFGLFVSTDLFSTLYSSFSGYTYYMLDTMIAYIDLLQVYLCEVCPRSATWWFESSTHTNSCGHVDIFFPHNSALACKDLFQPRKVWIWKMGEGEVLFQDQPHTRWSWSDVSKACHPYHDPHHNLHSDHCVLLCVFYKSKVSMTL